MVKSFIREPREIEKFDERNTKLRNTAERAFGFVVTFMPIMMMLMGGTIVALTWIGGHYVYNGVMLSGDLLAFFSYASEILMSIRRSTNSFTCDASKKMTRRFRGLAR